MRTRLRRWAVSAVALFTASAVLPSAAADARADGHRTSHGGLSAVIRYTEYGVPHIVAKDCANLGFGTGWAQAPDQVCVLADGFVTVRGGSAPATSGPTPHPTSRSPPPPGTSPATCTSEASGTQAPYRSCWTGPNRSARAARSRT